MARISADISGPVLFEPDQEKLMAKGLVAATAVVQPQNGTVPLCLMNMTDEPVHVYDRTYMGTIESCRIATWTLCRLRSRVLNEMYLEMFHQLYLQHLKSNESLFSKQ